MSENLDLMNGAVVDFENDVEELDFSPIPAGQYPAIVFGLELKTTKAGDSQYINWTFKITTGEHKGRQLWLATSLKPKALWKVKKTITATSAGALPPRGDLGSLMQWMQENLLGKPCVLDVVMGEYKGEPKNEVKDVFPEGHGGITGDSDMSFDPNDVPF